VQAFRIHLLVYFVATMVLFVANLMLAPGYLYVIWPLLAWGVVLALHAARVMDLLPPHRRRR